MGVITVTVERTHLTFNNETLVRVTSAWCGIPEKQNSKVRKGKGREKERFVVNAFSLKYFAQNTHISFQIYIVYNLL